MPSPERTATPPANTPEGQAAPNTRPDIRPDTRPDGPVPAPSQCWVVLGDIHGDVARLAAIPELAGADGVMITGDLTRLGGAASARAVIEAVEAINPVVLAQIGNMDRPEVDDWLEDEGINLHRKVRELAPGIAVMGVGGSTFTPFGTPSEFPEARFAEWLESLAGRAADYAAVVLVTHNPPYDTACDCSGGGAHVGSRAVREFIEEHQPDVCLCGHIHESRGEQRIGRTVVANPGAFGAGGYALLRLENGAVTVALRGLEA